MSGRAQGNLACAKFALGRVAPPDRLLTWLGASRLGPEEVGWEEGAGSRPGVSPDSLLSNSETRASDLAFSETRLPCLLNGQ